MVLGVIHGGYNEEPGSVRAKFCWRGNQMFGQLDQELRFGFNRNGSLVIAFTEADLKMLHTLKHRGEVGKEHCKEKGLKFRKLGQRSEAPADSESR